MNILAQLPPEIAGLLTEHTLVYATAAWVLLQNIGRIYQAIQSGGGLLGIWRGLVFGANVPHEGQELPARAAKTRIDDPKP